MTVPSSEQCRIPLVMSNRLRGGSVLDHPHITLKFVRYEPSTAT
jgi:hypothetical protein